MLVHVPDEVLSAGRSSLDARDVFFPGALYGVSEEDQDTSLEDVLSPYRELADLELAKQDADVVAQEAERKKVELENEQARLEEQKVDLEGQIDQSREELYLAQQQLPYISLQSEQVEAFLADMDAGTLTEEQLTEELQKIINGTTERYATV